MAGHSKFKNIMHRKGAQDAKRAKQFTKVGREIMVAARLGGSDPDMNPRLRSAITAARGVNMPNERIKKAIDSAGGVGESDNYSEVRYEGYGAGGVAVIVEALTDNKNRTAAEVRAGFSKFGGNLGETGSVAFMFDRVGEIIYKSEICSADEIFEAALEAGASNIESDDETHEIICEPDDFSMISDNLSKKFGEPDKAGLSWRANVNATINESQIENIMKLIDALEDSDDVQNVYTNLDINEELMAKISGL